MNCINTSTKEFQELLEASKLPSLLLEMEISEFQEKNGLESYPKLEDIIKPNEDSIASEQIPSVDWSGIISEDVEDMFPDSVSEETIEDPVKPNNNRKNLFGDTGKTTISASDALNNLISSEAFDNSNDVGFFLQQAMNLLNKSGAKVVLINEKSNKRIHNKFDNKSVMMFDSIDNTIYVTEDSLTNFDEITIASSLIHEIVHSTTVKAYFNAKTFEEKQFKAFIDKSFNQYRRLATKRDADGKLMYGFTNQAEFIAEIYSNPEFRKELQSIEKSWWSQFVDNVRRLFSMSKNIFNNELINSAILFEMVDDFATKDNSKWKGTIVNDPRYSKFGEDLFNKVVKPSNKTLAEKLDNLVNKQLNNIEVMIKRAAAVNSKQGSKSAEFIKSVKALEAVLNESAKTNKLKAINEYSDFMIKQIINVNNVVNNNIDKLSSLEMIARYESYLSASDLLKPIREAISDVRIKDLSPEDKGIVSEIANKLDSISGIHDRIVSTFHAHRVHNVTEKLKGTYFSEKVVQDFRREIAKDYPKDSKLSKNEWINEQVALRQDELDQRVDEDTNDVVDGISADIDSFDKNFLSALNTKSRLIQVVIKVIAKMKSKIDELVSNYDFKLDKLQQDLIKEKGKYDITNLYETSEDGTVYVKGEYSVAFRESYINEFSKLLDDANAIKESHKNSGYSEFDINQFKDVKEAYAKIAKWNAENTVKVNNITYPHPKYKNNLKFSKAEQAIYDEYIKLASSSELIFSPKNSLTRTSSNATYFMLPYATISGLERVTTGRLNPIDIAKQNLSDITQWKIDDIENGREEMFTPAGEKIFNVPVMYRNNISKTKEPKKYKELLKDQSYDLLTLMRLEHHNQTNFKLKLENELLLNSLKDIAKNKKYFKTKMGTNNLASNLLGIKTKHVEKDGADSNTFKRIESIVNQALYNVFHEEAKLNGKDVNKIVQHLNKHTSFLGMTLNYFNAPVNVLNAEFQTFITKLGKDIDAGKLREAHVFYAKDLPSILADAGRPVKHSVVNQLNLLTDVFGGLTHEQNDFIKNTLIKGIADPQLLQIMQNGGEHLVQSVLNIALLKSIKVMNSNQQYINKDGQVVPEKEAASIFDMVEQDKDTKQVTFNKDKFTYTNRSTATKWDEGGLENVRLFIKKKIFDSMGEYDKNFQTEFQKHWYGQLFSMYKKFVIPLGIARYRGINKSLTKREDLTEDDLHWNESLQEYEEGYYVTTFRFITRATLSNLAQLKFKLISENYNELSDYEKANLKKGIVELSILALLQLAIIPLLVGMAGDDDDEIMYLAMIARRLEQELSFYTDPNDAYKITNNPAAAFNLVESYINVGKLAISPGLWFSETKSGDSRTLKVLQKLVVPSALNPDKTAKTVMESMNQGLLAPYKEGMFYKLINE